MLDRLASKNKPSGETKKNLYGTRTCWKISGSLAKKSTRRVWRLGAQQPSWNGTQMKTTWLQSFKMGQWLWSVFKGLIMERALFEGGNPKGTPSIFCNGFQTGLEISSQQATVRQWYLAGMSRWMSQNAVLKCRARGSKLFCFSKSRTPNIQLEPKNVTRVIVYSMRVGRDKWVWLIYPRKVCFSILKPVIVKLFSGFNTAKATRIIWLRALTMVQWGFGIRLRWSWSKLTTQRSTHPKAKKKRK